MLDSVRMLASWVTLSFLTLLFVACAGWPRKVQSIVVIVSAWGISGRITAVPKFARSDACLSSLKAFGIGGLLVLTICLWLVARG